MLEHTHIRRGRIGLRALGVVSVLGTIAAFVLTILCIFAGSKPNMMENYDMFTVRSKKIQLDEAFLTNGCFTAQHHSVRR